MRTSLKGLLLALFCTNALAAVDHTVGPNGETPTPYAQVKIATQDLAQ